MAYDSNKGGITTKSDAGTMIYNYPDKPYALGAYLEDVKRQTNDRYL